MLRRAICLLAVLTGSLHALAIDRGDLHLVVYNDAILPRVGAPGAEWSKPRPQDLEHAAGYFRTVYSDAKDLGFTAALLNNLDAAYLEVADAEAGKLQMGAVPFLTPAYEYGKRAKTLSGKPVDADAREVMERVAKLSNTRVLYTFDEPTLEEIPRLAEYQRAMKVAGENLPPAVPCIVGLDRVHAYLEAARPQHVAYDLYPFYQGSPTSPFPEAAPGSIDAGWVDEKGTKLNLWEVYDDIRTRVGADAKLYPVIQAFGWAQDKAERFVWRPPLPAEVKLQALGLTALGAEGIWYFILEPGSGSNDWVALKTSVGGEITPMGVAAREANATIAKIWPALRAMQPVMPADRGKWLGLSTPHVGGVFVDPDDAAKAAAMIVNGNVLNEQTIRFKLWTPEGQTVASAKDLDGTPIEPARTKDTNRLHTFTLTNVPPGEARLILLQLSK